MHSTSGQTGLIGRFEDLLIAIFLGLMTLITFAGVIVRYIFGANWFEPVRLWSMETLGIEVPTAILWANEMTVFLFGWLVLLGAATCVKNGSHLGVDALVNVLSPGTRLFLTVLAGACCIAYAFLMLKGGWDYWANFANLPMTSGTWFPTGFEATKYNAWYEVNDVPMPGFLQFLADWMNEGEQYEKIPRFLPYAVIPLAMFLLLLRFVQATRRVIAGEQTLLIASHEVEDELAAIKGDK